MVLNIYDNDAVCFLKEKIIGLSQILIITYNT